LPAGVQSAIVETGGHGRLDPAVLRGLAPERAADVQQAFAGSFIDGFHLAVLIAGCVLLVAASISYRFIPSGAPQREFTAPPVAEAETAAAI
jgi:hypothetical protein